MTPGCPGTPAASGAPCSAQARGAARRARSALHRQPSVILSIPRAPLRVQPETVASIIRSNGPYRALASALFLVTRIVVGGNGRGRPAQWGMRTPQLVGRIPAVGA